MRVTKELIDLFLTQSPRPIVLPDPVTVVAIYLDGGPSPWGSPTAFPDNPWQSLPSPPQPQPIYLDFDRVINIHDNDGNIH